MLFKNLIFFIVVQKSKVKSGLFTSLWFSIAQHSRDFLLIKSFINFFGSGFVVNYKKRSLCEFIITKINPIVEYIIPFFNKHPILRLKHFNFLYFKNAAYIIKNKEYLNKDRLGLEQVLWLKKELRYVMLRYSNKAINNHSVVNGTEKLDLKR